MDLRNPYSLAGAEKRAIMEAMIHTHGNRKEAAKLLEIREARLRRKLMDHGIEGRSEHARIRRDRRVAGSGGGDTHLVAYASCCPDD
jgi:hypothetical protein